MVFLNVFLVFQWKNKISLSKTNISNQNFENVKKNKKTKNTNILEDSEVRQAESSKILLLLLCFVSLIFFWYFDWKHLFSLMFLYFNENTNFLLRKTNISNQNLEKQIEENKQQQQTNNYFRRFGLPDFRIFQNIVCVFVCS